MATETIAVKEKGLPTERVKKLRESLLETEPHISCERLHLLKESYKETAGQPVPIRVAKAYEKHLCGMTIFIDDNPLVGTQTQYRTGLVPYPEISCDWMVKEFEFSTYGGKFKTSDEDRKILKEAVDYWERNCRWARAREAFSQKYGMDYADLYNAGLFSTFGLTPHTRMNIDYGKVLNKGLEGVIAEAEEELRNLPLGPLDAYQKKAFLDAVVIACNAVIKFAQRYAALAREMAQNEKSPQRKRELEKIAQTCDWVPARPARTFYEAVQSFWFTHLAGELEDAGAGRSPGRFCLYMYPYYEKDKKEGNVTEEAAIELLELLFIKFSEIRRFLPESFFGHTMGSMMQNLTIGGVTATGEDAANEMDYLVLEAQKRVQMPQPTLSLLFHNKLPQDFLLKAVEVVRTGVGMPAFFNNDITIQRLLDHGASLEDARNCCLIGCVEGGFSHTSAPLRGIGFNIAKMLEMALNNGVDPLTGRQFGPKTGDPNTFKTYEELCEAVKKQFQYFQKIHEEFETVAAAITTEIYPQIFSSALVDDCIKNGKEHIAGGARYRMDGSGAVGMVNFGDSMAAIKKLVFEEKSITMAELLEALKATFNGYEELHKKLLEAPKYGNDIDYVDRIVKEWYQIFYDEHQKYKDHMGMTRRPYALSVSFHFPLGVSTGALPCGFKGRLPLADGSVSAEPGMDKSGPTALIRSATKVVDCVKYASNLLNMKIHPASLSNRESQLKLLAMIRTYMNMGGHHVQFNVVSAETLRDAQVHPENYRHLIVRVAGFSAFFIHLDPVVQNEIIKRSEIRIS
ncbi:MAG: pyruvate formate lyase family protein [Dehalococcoidia bacterium]|nr:pyruvate formate lyase family protein [Dehalococcoidia bacterium]